jgi:membrane-associated protease RseP (regulator of RpoE activity)
MLHELGHFATAKHYGMKATRFFVGFGPTIWSVRRGETEYGIKALPAGGFVRIEGMTTLEELAAEDEPRAFWRFPAGQRTVVLSAGSFMHFVIAILLVFGIFAFSGSDPIKSTVSTTVDQVEKCVPLSATATACTSSDPAAPAFGKLHDGDRITAVNGTAITSYDQMSRAIQSNPNKAISLTVVRDGKSVTLPITPYGVMRDGKLVGKLGIDSRVTQQKVSLLGAIPHTFTTLGSFITSTGSALGGLPHEVAGIFEGKPRDPEGAASVVDVARVSGQITSSGAGVGTIATNLLMILAELNLFVGLFNLLPLLPLDGGHIAIIGFEKARSGLSRVFHRRDPGRVDIMKVLPVTYAVFAVFVGLSLVLLYAGIANPIRLQ